MEDMAPGPLSVQPSSLDLANVAEIARTLQAHGGGVASTDLALDLVLHDFVEEARDATGASGAAVALIREDEMVCRATTGETAPDLGVRVESSSGLAGLCVTTGTVQHCKDSESDSRVNPELCRQLGVRSTLIAPLKDAGRVVGILQVFSALPQAFGDRDVETLQQFATRIDQSLRELRTPGATPAPDQIREIQSSPEGTPTWDENTQPLGTKGSDADGVHAIWSYILFVLVIAASIGLGLVVGWRRGSRDHQAASAIVQPAPVQAMQEMQSQSPTPNAPTPSGNITPPPAKTPPPSISIPAGGLVVTQNGRVIYRSHPEPPETAPDSSNRPAPRLVHRIEPDYPEPARAQNIQGPVVLEVEVLANGEVGNVNVVSGQPLLAQAAVNAVKQWRYEPADASIRTRVTIRFVLPAH